jgi:hypothetical protein
VSILIDQFLISCRRLSGDGPSDNYSRDENLNYQNSAVNGTNTIFYVRNAPIAPGGVMQLTVDNSLIPQPYNVPGLEINEVTGQIILASPPTTSVFCSYYYYLFDDPTWYEFILAAMQQLNLNSQGEGSLAHDISIMLPGIQGAAKSFAAYWFCRRVAQQTGLWYNQRLQEREEDRDTISKKWLALAETFYTQGIAMRNDFYDGAGSKFKPSFRIVENQPRPYTPRR